MEITGRGIRVAVLDTGIYPHPDFAGRILGFQDFLLHRRIPYDDCGHGTHVAGVLGGSGAASQGKYRGVAPECGIFSLKVLDHSGNGRKEDVLLAFQWLLENYRQYHIRVVNISVGTTYQTRFDHDALIRGVEALWDEGLVVVAAAGNQGPRPGSITAPGCSKKIITVGSSDMLEGMKGVSGRGPTFECVCKPDLVAPGRSIISCNARKHSAQEYYTRKSGTSMSTPVISGAAALLLQHDPLLSNVEVKMILKNSTIDLGLPRNLQGWGAFSMEKMKKEAGF